MYTPVCQKNAATNTDTKLRKLSDFSRAVVNYFGFYMEQISMNSHDISFLVFLLVEILSRMTF